MERVTAFALGSVVGWLLVWGLMSLWFRKYFLLTVKHKWFVFLAGLKVGCPLWRLIIHDWTKLLLWNLAAYDRQFFGKADDPRGFIEAWLRHQNAHDHHWEWWIARTGHNRCTPPYPDGEPVEMSRGAALEMLADWMGASRAYEGKWPVTDNWPWFDSNFEKIKIHESTRAYLVAKVFAVGLISRERWLAL